MRKHVISAILLWFLFICAACDSRPADQTVERVRSEVAKILMRDSSEIDVTKSLTGQGADELDIVEIVMAVEEAFEVEIPDSAIGDSIDEVSSTLSVQKLAEIVAERRKSK